MFAEFIETPTYKLLSLTGNCVSFSRNNDMWGTVTKLVEDSYSQKVEDLEKDTTLNFENIELDHVTVVLDEAVSLEFSNDLIGCGRDLCRRFQTALKATNVDLVVAGTGLERLAKMEVGQIGRLGTDLSRLDLITVERPEIDRVIAALTQDGKKIDEQWQNAIREGINDGSYSRVAATNSRMFFEGVLPTWMRNIPTT